jgi:hypothetical protein
MIKKLAKSHCKLPNGKIGFDPIVMHVINTTADAHGSIGVRSVWLGRLIKWRCERIATKK